jgi:hypothetical protein
MGKESEDDYGNPCGSASEVFAMADETTTIVSSVFIPPEEIDYDVSRVSRIIARGIVAAQQASIFRTSLPLSLPPPSLSLYAGRFLWSPNI